ncbi:MAG: hypothetical protein DI595_20840 [Agrobacterium fabrum]|uniref:Uncharacterized protein n=1 Tax=Agrobacterium fabrum TaxID=1176649 RepID=A0A2W5EMU6_9HYPH|nr:MAG: hypothetical protein DI595_20840 [Agrobacterium fabrum]
MIASCVCYESAPRFHGAGGGASSDMHNVTEWQNDGKRQLRDEVFARYESHVYVAFSDISVF